MDVKTSPAVESAALNKLTYGLFLLTAREGEKDNGCIINTAAQVTSSPKQITIAVNKGNLTHDLILRTGVFNVSILSEKAPFGLFQRFGFQSGRDADKFAGYSAVARSENGLYYGTDACAVLSGQVSATLDCGTHTLFLAQVTEARQLSAEAALSYGYYTAHIKPASRPAPVKAAGKRWVCGVCGYVYDEEKEGVPFQDLPEDWVCPLCKHPKSDFELE